MNILRKFAAVFLAVLLLFSLIGCDSEEYSQSIYADIGGEVSTLDPQLVSSSPDRITVLNLFQGLMALDSDGNAVPAAAESFEKNGNTYVFTLRKGLKWNDGSALTAEDFVFGLTRAADDATAAPDYESISCIKGAEEMHSGQTETLSGVYAKDGKVIITLSREDRDFLKNLAKPVSMPCNREFFLEAKGKYGRDKENLLSNGAYYVRSWNTEKYLLRISRNEHFTGERPVAANVYFTSADEIERLEQLKKNNIDIAFVPCDSSKELQENGLLLQKYFNRCWFIFINKDSMGDENIHKALQMSIHRSKLENEMPDYIKPLTVALPLTATLDGKLLYERVAKANTLSYNPDEAYALYSLAAQSLEGTEPPKIIYPIEGKIDRIVSEIAAGWQQTLACFVNMEGYESNAGVLSTVKNGIYKIAVCSIDAATTDAYDYLCNFKTGNPYGFSNETYDSLVDSLPTLKGDAYVNTVKLAQSELLMNSSIIPLCVTSTDIAFSSALSSSEYNINGGFIDFSKIIKQ